LSNTAILPTTLKSFITTYNPRSVNINELNPFPCNLKRIMCFDRAILEIALKNCTSLEDIITTSNNLKDLIPYGTNIKRLSYSCSKYCYSHNYQLILGHPSKEDIESLQLFPKSFPNLT